MSLYLELVNFGVKIKTRNIRGYTRGFSVFTVFVACTTLHIFLPFPQVWTPAF